MGMPKHPAGSTTRTDDQGEYIHYHRTCTDCGVELTSRNRSQANLLCKPCVAARAKKQYDIKALAGEGRPKRRSPAQAAVAAARRENPDRKHCHHLLEAYLNHPTNESIKKGLQSFLLTL